MNRRRYSGGLRSSAHPEIIHEPGLGFDLIRTKSELFRGDGPNLLKDSLLCHQSIARAQRERLGRDGSRQVSESGAFGRKLGGNEILRSDERDGTERKDASEHHAARHSQLKDHGDKRANPKQEQQPPDRRETPPCGLGGSKSRHERLQLGHSLPPTSAMRTRKHHVQGSAGPQRAAFDTAVLNDRLAKAEERSCCRANTSRARKPRNDQRREIGDGANAATLSIGQLDPEPVFNLHHQLDAVKAHGVSISDTRVSSPRRHWS